MEQTKKQIGITIDFELYVWSVEKEINRSKVLNDQLKLMKEGSIDKSLDEQAAEDEQRRTTLELKVLEEKLSQLNSKLDEYKVMRESEQQQLETDELNDRERYNVLSAKGLAHMDSVERTFFLDYEKNFIKEKED